MAGGKRIKAVTSSEVFKLFPLPSCLRRQNFTRPSFLFAGELINCLTLWSMRSNDEAAFRKLLNTSGKSHCVCVCSEHGGNTDAAIDTPIAVAPGMWSWSVQRRYQTNRGCSSGNNNNDWKWSKGHSVRVGYRVDLNHSESNFHSDVGDQFWILTAV